jgi:hypothetical protein
MRAVAIVLIAILSLALAAPVEVEEPKLAERAVFCNPDAPGVCATLCTTSGYLRCGTSYVSTHFQHVNGSSLCAGKNKGLTGSSSQCRKTDNREGYCVCRCT